ncbi:MAG: hypothetical protein IKO80_05760 [Lachnospiraceae bacterium]|nr:hypothetical protein [Lachnospiraceae bacterium]
MNNNSINSIARWVFLLITFMTLWYLNDVLKVKDEHGTKQTLALYYQPSNSIDVAMLGSSHIHCDIDPGILWTEYGIASYDFSAAEQPLWITYHYLIEFCKYQNPQVIVLDLYSAAKRKEDYQYDWIRPNIHGLRFSVNKLQMLWVSVERNRLRDYFPDFVYYHDRIGKLTEDDWLYPFRAPDELCAFKGYTPYFNDEEQEEPDLAQVHSGGLTAKQEIYLQKIITYTQQHNIELFLIVTPYITNDQDELVFNRIREIAEMNGLDFNSTNYDYDGIGLDFETDFNDGSHLNYRGAEKFSAYLGKELKSRFDLPDRRGDARYESWEINSSLTEKYIKENS